ncbi:MAG TPA: hypothetical protein VLE91_00035 [Candidatus Saccharimonadales bacterium]|nr:hypothetical protein [Candidatus Saccharimonadales bacterium]
MLERSYQMSDGAINYGQGIIGPSFTDQKLANQQSISIQEELFIRPVQESEQVVSSKPLRLPKFLLPVLGGAGALVLVACGTDRSNPKINADQGACRTVDINPFNGRQVRELVRNPQSQGYVLVDPRDFVIMASYGDQEKIIVDSLVERPFPSISFDGQSVAYIKDRDIHVIRIDGVGDRQVTDVKGLSDDDTTIVKTTPAWSPDSQKIAYVTKNLDSGSYSARVLNISTGKSKEISRTKQSGTSYIAGLTWSPDGNTIAYAAADKAVSKLSLFYADLRSEDERKDNTNYFEVNEIGKTPEVAYAVRLKWLQDKGLVYGICPDPAVLQ